MCHHLERRLDCRIESVPAGRHFLADALQAWGVDLDDPAQSAADRALLVVSELLANAVKACHATVRLEVTAHHDRIEIVVGDDSPLPAVLQRPTLGSPGGRGLALVDALSERWGQRPWDGAAKDVWATVAVPAGSALAKGCTLGEARW